MWCPASVSPRTTIVHDLYDPSCVTTQTSWHDLPSIRRRHPTFSRIQPKRQHFPRDCRQENGTLCHQYPSVYEDQHAEAERRQNRDPHHPSEICKPTDLSVAVVPKLQRAQNACARVLLIRPKRDHVTPMVLKLHWLPVKCRITFKTLLLTFKFLHGLAPTYLSALLSPYCPTRSLRSSDQLLLNQPTSRTKIGERSFSCAAPSAWNQLPNAVRQCTSVNHFKVALKTHLFIASLLFWQSVITFNQSTIHTFILINLLI